MLRLLVVIDLEMHKWSMEINHLGSKGINFTTDLTNIDSIQDMISKIIEEFGTVDILVNNAGTSQQNLR